MIPPDDERPPDQRGLRIASFSAHAARGLLRDQTMRRKAMFWTVIGAVAMLFGGSTFLAPALDPRTYPARFILYWVVCAWLTVTVVLLAIFDLLMVRAQARAERRSLAGKMTESADSQEEA
jgi:hypothetical protein